MKPKEVNGSEPGVDLLANELSTLLKTWDELTSEIEKDVTLPKKEKITLLRQLRTGLNKLAQSITPRITEMQAKLDEENFTNKQYGCKIKRYSLPGSLLPIQHINHKPTEQP